jgi:cell division protein FtsW (lipid II flippase)
MLRLLAVLFLLVLFGYPVFRNTRFRAQASRHDRARQAWRAVLGVVAGLVLALWLAPRIPETDGSPASLVATVVLWVVGGGVSFLSAAALAGALAARPEFD